MPENERTSEEKSSRSYWGFVLWLVAVLLLSAISLSAADATTNTVPLVTVSNLLAHAKEYNRKKVEVIGYYRIGSELSAIWDTKKDAETLSTLAAVKSGLNGFSSHLCAFALSLPVVGLSFCVGRCHLRQKCR